MKPPISRSALSSVLQQIVRDCQDDHRPDLASRWKTIEMAVRSSKPEAASLLAYAATLDCPKLTFRQRLNKRINDLDPPKSAVIRAMAWDLDTFMERVRGKVWGAAHHYVSVALDDLNGKNRYRAHWNGEIDRLIDIELPDVLSHDTTVGPKARTKAALRALDAVASKSKTLVTVGTNHWSQAENKGKRPTKPFPENGLQPFFDRVRRVIESA